ncbi:MULTISPECIES: lipopolysaccharide biosynthesis protein [unclassified Amedibacterium]|uniref:lipopolysaccharide biosynthesis protein n=1 Tax=unclassified Amedibacterium TaxID=3088137 RepID=UPI000E3F42BB|nr:MULTISPECIES: oligosaccharide flippase family protein [unclassified Absiella]RGB65530.1 flippase [Absiella sp. AM09-45]RGB74516.1 flippase [Absiella sp. AM09-50]RGC53203.1 flippase [Absiella sp. AM29-15]
MEKNRKKYLIKNTLIFTLGNLGSKLITFFLIPLYTSALTTAQYGVVDLVTTVSTVAIPLLTINICESVMRFALDKDADQEQITQIGTYIFFIACLFGTIVIPICAQFEQISPYAVLTYFYVITLAASQLYLCDLRGKEQLLFYSIGNILHTFFIAVFNIIFLLAFKMQIEGYLLAFICANLVTFFYALLVGKGYKSFRLKKINKKLLKDMAKYSIVLIPNSFMWWIMNSSDRIMVSSMVGIAANGIYAVSYKLPTLVSTLTSIFNQAWSYSAIREDGACDEEEYNNRIFKMLIGIVMLIGIGIITFVKPFLSIYVSDKFFIAWKYTPFLIIGYVYLTLGSFMATSYTVHKDSFGYLFSGIFGAIFNIILNFVLIPIINVYGAAIATCMSYFFVFIFRLIHTKKYIKYKIGNIEFILGSIILIFSSAIIYINNNIGFVIQLLLFGVAVCILGKPWLQMLKKVIGTKRK